MVLKAEDDGHGGAHLQARENGDAAGEGGIARMGVGVRAE
jgi:hypothetical protein